MARRKRLYSEAERREFERRYGRRGDEVYGRTLNKVARERAAENGGTYVEEIPGHFSFSKEGRREWVKPHQSRIHAESHGPGHHPGSCSAACRKGHVPHRHRRRRGFGNRRRRR
jgi:hypothetical protein